MSINCDSKVWRDFLDRNHLRKAYLESTEEWYLPLIRHLNQRAENSSMPVLVALNGCQGSGKSTLSDFLATYLVNILGNSVEVLSLDDFYLGHEARQRLARDVHPLLATRGVPGTHDTALLNETLDRLIDKRECSGTLIPRFDKSIDDRKPEIHWSVVNQRLDIILLEGWCLGAEPVALANLSDPINDLERAEDRDLIWRKYVNQQLRIHYLPVFSRFDTWIMLKAPSFKSVFSWRLEQEQKLGLSKAAEGGSLMNSKQLLRFIQHYERITLACLSSLPDKVDFLYALDEKRNVLKATYSDRIREALGFTDL